MELHYEERGSSQLVPLKINADMSNYQILRLLRQISLVVISVIAALFALLPILWVFSSSINPVNTLSDPRIIPQNATLENYINLLLGDKSNFLRWLKNSLLIASTTSLLSTLITSLGAYSLSRYRFKGRKQILTGCLLVQVFPNTLVIVALYLIIHQIGEYIPAAGLNSLGGLVLVYMGGVTGGSMWLTKGFFDSIPAELDDAARIDGASHWITFTKVILPLARPMLAVVALLTFIGVYCDFILARIIIADQQYMTLAVGLFSFIDGAYTQNWGEFAAGALVGAIPVIIIFVFLQDAFVSGITKGAVKG